MTGSKKGRLSLPFGIAISIILPGSICLAPVNHALGRFSTAYALVAEVLLLEGDTS